MRRNFSKSISSFRKYSEEHTTLVLGTIFGTLSAIGAVLVFLWDNLRPLFWLLSIFIAVLVLFSLVWCLLPQPKQPTIESKKNTRTRTEKDWAWLFNVGENNQHVGSWEVCRKYGFLSAGGGSQYQDDAKKLSVGDPVYAYVTKVGYVGFGEVLEEAVPIREFAIGSEKRPLLSAGVLPEYVQRKLESDSDHPTNSDWVVRVRWHKTYSKQDAVAGIWASPKTVCQLTNRKNLDLLRERFA